MLTIGQASFWGKNTTEAKNSPTVKHFAKKI
jgi:hypothetical protein